jgi:hypothetical protein
MRPISRVFVFARNYSSSRPGLSSWLVLALAQRKGEPLTLLYAWPPLGEGLPMQRALVPMLLRFAAIIVLGAIRGVMRGAAQGRQQHVLTLHYIRRQNVPYPPGVSDPAEDYSFNRDQPRR